ncbi:class F sortase [Geomicrobium sp. JCM 19055]|uniref:class F sortase n=1 Tax=Geomicrobium sp. JCM 19055 TaxID=1460649 RepID=UPI00045EDC94|nr:class F sortase [Geomicrobium sp. JCM 19055]GAJ99978.1 putative secreted protein [Geomicrobium sp. JCM 19055]
MIVLDQPYFFDLDELEEGDSILVAGEDGEELEYVVERLESYPFDDSPVDEIFGSSDTKQLNLITCAGIFDRDVGTHDERLVVYTSLIDDEEDEELQPSSPTELTVQGTLLTWHAVREDHVAGYRIYSVDAEGTEAYVASVSQTERKAIQMTDEQENYIIKTIDYFGNESDAENVTVAE